MRLSNMPYGIFALCSFITSIGLPLNASAVPNPAAEVVSVEGVGEYRADARRNWATAKVEQDLFAGNYVRTGSLSRMGLLFSDRTQIRMNEKSLLRVKAVQSRAPDSGKTILRLERGRAWTQAKDIPQGLIMETPSATAAIRGTDWDLEVDNNGTATLTVLSGEVEFFNKYGKVTVSRNEQARAEVGKAPVKMLIVQPEKRVQWVTSYAVEPLRHISLHGGNLAELKASLAKGNIRSPVSRGYILADLGRWKEAEENFSSALKAKRNDSRALLGMGYVALHKQLPREAKAYFDEVRAGNKEQELLDLGRIAVDIQEQRLAAAASRLQALSRNRLAQPATYLVQSDLMVYSGNLEHALSLANKAVQQFPRNARGYSQLARINLLADQIEKSRQQIARALEHEQNSYEALLAQGELGRIEGDAKGATSAYTEAADNKPDDDRAWHGLGVIHTEKENVTQARADLGRALVLNPHGHGYQGERGTLETFANNFDTAEVAFTQALKENPDDYVSLTGKGVMLLKQGKTEAALDTFLRAGLMEPRYARVHVYTAVAYYQLGKVRQALEELERAGKLDNKDPLPHYMASIIYTDLLRPDDAITEARQALRLMPYLKSLNQLANTQRGTTNLGQAFAFMGMEEWARMYAQESYNPFWAGSHLFLADRYNGLFTKNSELFQGFLSDPLVFGADNRFQTLIAKPGHNLSASVRATTKESVNRDGADGTSPLVEANGMDNSVTPFAYYLGYENFDLKFDDGPYKRNSGTAALGLQPMHNLGLFLFGDSTHLDTGYENTLSGITFDYTEKLDSDRKDLGLHYKLSPTNQFWVKVGEFNSRDNTGGTIGDPVLNFPQDFTLKNKVDAPEYALRYSFKLLEQHELTVGYEQAERKTALTYDQYDIGDSLNFGTPTYDVINQRYAETSNDFYLSDRFTLNPDLLLQLDLFYQDHERKVHEDFDWRIPAVFGSTLVQQGPDSDDLYTYNQVSPRLGMVYKLGANKLLRIAYQDWVRPASQGSLGPVATAGIPLDDRMVLRGGELKRLRGQFEWELTPKTFANLFFDRKEIDNNLFTVATPFTISELESLGKLRSRDMGALTRDDPLEFVNTPEYEAGEINSAGIAANHLLSGQWGLFASYTYNDAKNTGDAFKGNELPYLPQHTTAAGATWTHPAGWYFVSRLTYRSDRYTNESNTVKRTADLTGAADLYWQSAKKEWLFRFSIDDAFSDNTGTQYTAEVNFRY